MFLTYHYFTAGESSLNSYRAKNGIESLSYSLPLENSARERAINLKSSDTFTHDGYKEVILKYYGAGYQVIGENIAHGFETKEDAMEAWKHSETHNRLMLNSELCEYGMASHGDIYVLHVGCR